MTGFLRPAPAAASSAGPLGATVLPGGVNFSVYSRGASAIELLLFDRADDARTIRLDPAADRTYHYWHVFVPGAGPGQIYGYRAHGSWDPANGVRFDPSKVLLDPYGRAVVVPDGYSREAARHEGVDTAATSMKSVVADPSAYDWEGDAPLQRPSSQTIIYEMHVKGFTRHPSSGVPEATRGTYAGVIETIPYLQKIGITAVELLPVFQFDAQDAPPGRINYWGYSPISFFGPHQAYSSSPDPLAAIDEFRDMVKALHRAGIEVILDVVFNHTAEGDHRGPTVSLRGLDNATYYILEEDRSRYANYSGTGNTLNANHPIVRRMIVDSLRYWVTAMPRGEAMTNAAGTERSLPRLLLVLTAVTGLVDAVSYLALGRVFTANMTGNVVLLGFATAAVPGLSVPRSAAALGSFVLGALAGGRLAAALARGPRLRWASIGFGIEAVLLLAAAALAARRGLDLSRDPGRLYGLIATTGIEMGVRNSVVRKLSERDLTTTVLTLTITGIAADSSLAGGDNAGWPRRAGSVALMFGGALTGALLLRSSVALPIAVAGILSGLCALGAFGLLRSAAPVPRMG